MSLPIFLRGDLQLFCFAVVVCIIQCLRSVEASLIAPFEYVAIPLGVVWGILIWNEWPDKMALIGIVLILAGGLTHYIVEYEIG